MLSINANPSALTAVRNFFGAGVAVNEVANRIGTGLKVAGAKDDASNFSIAQGIRGEVRAWEAVRQGLGTAKGALSVTIAGATAISELLTDLKKKTVEYFSTDAARQPIVENDINELLDQIDLMANGATFGSLNLINTDQPSLAFTPPPDQGTVFTLNGPGSNSHALGTQAGLLQVNFTATESGGGQIRLVYNGSIVDSAAVNPPNASGSLTFAYDATGPTNFTVQKVGSPNVDTDYSFTLTPTGQSGVEGDYKVLKSADGSQVDIQFRSLLATDIGLRPPVLSNVVSALGQIEAAERVVQDALGYYGGKAQEVEQSMLAAEDFLDAQTVGLGNIVDADIARESARLTAAQVRETLARDVLGVISRSSRIFLDLVSKLSWCDLGSFSVRARQYPQFVSGKYRSRYQVG